MAAWIWYGPGPPVAAARRSARSSTARPSEIWVPPRPVLVGQQDEVTGGVEPGCPPGVVQQHQRQQPAGFGLAVHLRRR
jgi:hypothetical protein